MVLNSSIQITTLSSFLVLRRNKRYLNTTISTIIRTKKELIILIILLVPFLVLIMELIVEFQISTISSILRTENGINRYSIYYY